MIDAFTDISLAQLLLVVAVALFASLIGGVAGYGTGALMPLILVPMVGPEPVVPIIAISALLTHSGRTVAFRSYVDYRRSAIVILGAVPPCVLTAWGYTRLTSAGAMLLIGAMLMLTVPLRIILRRRAVALSEKGLLVAATGYGTAVGGTVGAGVILLSILMASGLAGAAVVATDAAISIVIGFVRLAVFGIAGAVDAQVLAFALLIGGIAFPGAFLARALVERLSVRVHSMILDAVVLAGGAVLVFRALVG